MALRSHGAPRGALRTVIDESPVAALFKQLVSIPSPSGSEHRVAMFIRDWLAEHGVESEFDASGGRNESDCGNLVATVPGAAGYPSYLFVAHMDTVETGAEAIRPVTSPDGVIRSAGSTILGADNKSAVAAVMRLCVAAVQMSPEDRPTVHAAFTTREEAGLMGVSLLDLGNYPIACAFCVDGSKPIGTAITAALGQAVFGIVVRGRAAHAAHDPESGVNAIRVAGEIVARLPLGRQTHGGSINVAAIIGGTALDRLGTVRDDASADAHALPESVLRGASTNVVPDIAVVRGEARAYDDPTLTATLDLVSDAVAATCGEHGAEHEWHVDRAQGVPPFSPAPGGRALALFQAAVADLPGITYAQERAHATLEANYLASAHDTIAVASGGREPHELTESISVTELDQLESLLLRIVERGRSARSR